VRAAALRLASGAGRLSRHVLTIAPDVPGIAGASLVVLGLGMAWRPIGFVAAGAFLLLVDWRAR
jgi:hypothetical protein